MLKTCRLRLAFSTPDGLFQAVGVITESVIASPEDKQRAADEYARVTKPGGYVGLNETAWLKMPPLPEVVAWASQEVGASVKPQTPDEWAGLLAAAGLGEIVAQTYAINVKDEARGIVRRYGLGGTLRVLGRMLRLYARSPAYRKFVKGVGQQGVAPANLEAYFGYGLYVGRK